MDDDMELEVHRAFQDAARDDDGEDFIPWNDPRGKRWRRALASKANQSAKYKRAAKAAEQETERIRSEFERKESEAAELLDGLFRTCQALEEKYRDLYVDHHLLLASQDSEAETSTASGDSPLS